MIRYAPLGSLGHGVDGADIVGTGHPDFYPSRASTSYTGRTPIVEGYSNGSDRRFGRIYRRQFKRATAGVVA
jgi:hypothetical protein